MTHSRIRGIEPQIREPPLFSQLFIVWHGVSTGLKDGGAPPFFPAGLTYVCRSSLSGRQKKS